MPYFFPLGQEPEDEDNQITEELFENIAIFDELTSNKTLNEVIEKLSDSQGWYPLLRTYGDVSLVKATWLWTLKKINAYNQNFNLERMEPNQEVVQLPVSLVNIERKMAFLYIQGNKAPGIKLLDELLAILNELITWINTEAKLEDHNAILPCLVMAKTVLLQLDGISYFIRSILGPKKIDLIKDSLQILTKAVITRLNPLTPEEIQRIEREREFEIKMTIEQHLDQNLTIVHHNIFSEDLNGVIAFLNIDKFFLARKDDFELLYQLKSMQELFVKNDEKIIDREYFSDLTGMKGSTLPIDILYKRRDWFERVLEICDEEDKNYLINRRKSIENPMFNEQIEKDLLYLASTTLMPAITAMRGVWRLPILKPTLDHLLDKPVVKTLTEYTQTSDSNDKKKFLILLNKLLITYCQKIFPENKILTEKLISSSSEYLNELKTKTEQIRRLYQADKKLFDFIREYNTFASTLYNLFCRYGLSTVPIMQDFLRKAIAFQNTIEGLKQSVYRGGVTEARISEIEKAVNELEEQARTGKAIKP